MLSKFVGAITCLLDIDSDIVSRMSLIIDIESCVLEQLDDQCQSVIVCAREEYVIYINNKYDIIMVEDTFIDLRFLEADLLQVDYHVLIPNLSGLLLAF
jgi:hypothetical protein